MRKIVFDLETKNTFDEAGSPDPADLDMSLAGIYDSETNRYTSYVEEELPHLWKILERADVLIGYNSNHFDIPLLNKYYPGDLTRIKSIDILGAIKQTLGRRLRLDSVSLATLGIKKSGYGLQVIDWWKNGEIQKIRDYCLQDVKITKELYDYALAHGSLKYKDWGDIREVHIDTSDWEREERGGMTHSLF